MDFVDVFVKFRMLRALSINSWGKKRHFNKKMSLNIVKWASIKTSTKRRGWVPSAKIYG